MAKAVAKKRKKPGNKEVCFVIMPFGGWFDSYYRDIYCPAIRSAGLEPHRADDLYRPSAIIHDIWAYTKKAKIILADISGKNPNVFYELGLAHAIAKPAILVTESLIDVPFDLRTLRVHEYDKNISDWGKILRKKIELSLEEIIKSPKESVLATFLGGKESKDASADAAKQQALYQLISQTENARDRVENSKSDYPERRLRNPAQARQFMHELLRSGMPEALVIEELTERGAPARWVLEQINRLKRTDSRISGRLSTAKAHKRK